MKFPRYAALFVALSFLATSAVAVTTDGQASARGRYRTRSSSVAPGLTLKRILDRSGPNRIRVLTLDPSSQLTLDVALGTDEIPGHERPSSVAARRGAIAAVNGDYTIRASQPGGGRPVNLFAEDGDLKTSPLIYGRNFGPELGEQGFHFGHPEFAVSVEQADSGEVWQLDGWNDWIFLGEMAGYTPDGATTFRPPTHACSARLFPTGPVAWAEGEAGVRRDHTVDVVRCAAARMKRRGGVVISAMESSEEALQIQGLLPGESVAISWTSGWPRILDTVGGNPNLLEDGQDAIGECDPAASFCRRHPRTGIGLTGTGQILLVTVDGRAPDRSVGMTPWEFAGLFRHLGAEWALNLDGGGATAMVVKGRIVNSPSDGSERAVGSAVLILPGSDGAEPVPGTAGPLGPRPVPAGPSPFARSGSSAGPHLGPGCRALTDPGSTGGLLDAIATGALGPSRRLEPPLANVVDVFRGVRDCGGRRVVAGAFGL